MWNLIAEYWHWGAGIMALRTLLRLCWNVVVSYPSGKVKDAKIEEMAALTQIQADQIASLRDEVKWLRERMPLIASSSASPESTPTSPTTLTLLPSATTPENSGTSERS